MRRGLSCAILAVGFASAAAVASAQTDSVPVELPEAPASDAAETSDEAGVEELAEAEEAKRGSRWDYSIGAGAGWESDVALQALEPGGPSDYSGSTFLELSWSAVRPRSRARLTGSGSATFYAEQKDYDRWDGNASFAASRSLSPRATGTLGLASSYGHSNTSRILSDQGVVLPQTRVIDYYGTVGLDVQVARYSKLGLGARFYQVDFPESPLLQDSRSLRLTATLDRRLEQRSTVSAEYSFEGTDSLENGLEDPDAPGVSVPGASYWTHYLSAVWQRDLTEATSVRVRTGASYTPGGQGQSLPEWRFYGGLSLSRDIGRTRLNAAYSRETLPVFGQGGLRFADRFSVNMAIPLMRRWQMNLAGYYMMDAEADEAGERASTADGTAGLSARLSERFWLSARGRYYWRASFQGVEGLENVRVGLFLVFGSHPGSALRY